MTHEELLAFIQSGVYQLHQALAGSWLAGALLNPDPKAAKALMDAYVQSQKDLAEALRTNDPTKLFGKQS